MKTKEPKYSEQKSRVAANILTAFMFCKTKKEYDKVWKEVYDTYQLCDDPFTSCPCSRGEYAKNSLEFDRQTMDEKYGHHDGLD